MCEPEHVTSRGEAHEHGSSRDAWSLQCFHPGPLVASHRSVHAPQSAAVRLALLPVHDDAAAAARTATVVSNKALVVRTASIASAITMRVRRARRITFGEFVSFQPVDTVIDGDLTVMRLWLPLLDKRVKRFT